MFELNGGLWIGMLVLMGHDDVRSIADIVGGDDTYRHFGRRIRKEFEVADEERNTHVYVLYKKNESGKTVGFAVIGHSAAKMKTWEEAFLEEGWVDEDYEMTIPCFELMYMYIRPEEREKGFGSGLFEEVMTFAGKQKIKAVYAYVGDKLPVALNFYRRRGATVIKNLSDDGVSNAFLEWVLS